MDNVSHGKGAVYNDAGATCTILGGNYTRSQENGQSDSDSGGNLSLIHISLPGGRSGLVHISEIAHSYVANVSDFLSEGQAVKGKVVSIDAVSYTHLTSVKGSVPDWFWVKEAWTVTLDAGMVKV